MSTALIYVALVIGGFIVGLFVAVPPKMGTLHITESDSKDTYRIEIGMDLEKLKKRKLVMLDISMHKADEES